MVKRRTVTQAQVVETAVQLANQAGAAESVSLKQLAAELDIKVPSLYNHVEGSAGLLRMMRLFGLEAMLRVLRESSFGKVGQEALMAVAHSYRSFALQNPGLYPITQQVVDSADEEAHRLSTELVQHVALLFASYGLVGDEAIHAIRGFRALVHGFTSLELSDGFGLPQDVDESFERLIKTYLNGLKE